MLMFVEKMIVVPLDGHCNVQLLLLTTRWFNFKSCILIDDVVVAEVLVNWN